MEPRFYSIRDRGRQIDFEGFHLANGSSHHSSKPRWFVVDIYKTVGGKYIVAGSGKSRVVHRENCKQMKEKAPSIGPALATSVGCDVCHPNLTDDVAHEIDREWAQVSEDAKAILDRLRLRDSEGVWYLPKTSTTALMQAAEQDEGIRDAFYAPQHVK